MSVLVCIPTHNSQDGISETVKSVLNQDFVDFDILIVDNKSSDRTVEVIEQLKKNLDREGRIRIVQNEENLGRVGNWNRCLELFLQSNHEYLKFLFTGDILYEQCLSILIRAFKEYPQAEFVMASYKIIYAEGRVLEKRSFAEKRIMTPFSALFQFVLRRNWAGAPISFMVKKDALRNIRFSESLQWGADWKLYIDIVEHTHSVYVPDIIGSLDIAQRKHYQKLYGSSLMIREEVYIWLYCITKIAKKLIL